MSAKKKARQRQIFVLTPEEKKAIAFVLCALVLGVATKHYRDKHPQPPRPLSAKEHRAAKKIENMHHVSPSIPTKPGPADR
jgi:hypothetical protein